MLHTYATASDFKRTQVCADYIMNTWYAYQTGEFTQFVDHDCTEDACEKCAELQAYADDPHDHMADLIANEEVDIAKETEPLLF